MLTGVDSLIGVVGETGIEVLVKICGTTAVGISVGLGKGTLVGVPTKITEPFTLDDAEGKGVWVSSITTFSCLVVGDGIGP